MAEVPQDDAEEFIAYIRENGPDELADYLELLYKDYYDGNLTDSDRYYRIKETHDNGVDISSIIDLAVQFGFVWEREDPMEEHDEWCKVDGRAERG